MIKNGENKLKKITVTTGNQSSNKVDVFREVKAGEQVVTNPDESMLDNAE